MTPHGTHTHPVPYIHTRPHRALAPCDFLLYAPGISRLKFPGSNPNSKPLSLRNATPQEEELSSGVSYFALFTKKSSKKSFLKYKKKVILYYFHFLSLLFCRKDIFYSKFQDFM